MLAGAGLEHEQLVELAAPMLEGRQHLDWSVFIVAAAFGSLC